MPEMTTAIMSTLTLMVLALSLSTKFVLSLIHNCLTKRDYSIQIDDLCDIVILSITSVLLYNYFSWRDLPIDPTYASLITTRNENFGFQTVMKQETGQFPMLVFLSLIVIALYIRFLLMLQLTKNFGPTLRIIITMVQDMTKFLIIWLILFILLATLCSILFGDVEKYSGFLGSALNVFDTSMGNYDWADFDADITEEDGEEIVNSEEAAFGVLQG